jgi:hypothetical protein
MMAKEPYSSLLRWKRQVLASASIHVLFDLSVARFEGVTVLVETNPGAQFIRLAFSVTVYAAGIGRRAASADWGEHPAANAVARSPNCCPLREIRCRDSTSRVFPLNGGTMNRGGCASCTACNRAILALSSTKPPPARLTAHNCRASAFHGVLHGPHPGVYISCRVKPYMSKRAKLGWSVN